MLSVPESRAVDVYGPAERAFNHSMSAQRIVIEWVRASGAAQRCRTLDTFVTRAQFFNDVVSKFRYLDSVRKMKIEAAGDVSASYRRCDSPESHRVRDAEHAGEHLLRCGAPYAGGVLRAAERAACRYVMFSLARWSPRYHSYHSLRQPP